MTNQRLFDCIAAIKDAFPRAEISPQTIAVYTSMLADLPPDDLERAVADLLGSSEFFPTIAAIRGAVFERRLQLPPVAEAVRQLTAGRTPTDFHPLVWEARMAVGDPFDWRERGDSVLVAQARKVYEDLRATRLREANLGSAGLLPEPPERPALEAVAD